MSYWYQYATTSNRLNRSYVNGFVDISGGDLTLRNSNFNLNGLIAQNTYNVNPTTQTPGTTNVAYSYISWNDVSNNFLSSQNSGTLNGSLSITNDLSVNGNLFVNSQSNHQITVTATSFAVTEDMSLNGRLYVSSDLSLNGRLFVGSDVLLGGRLFVNGDASFNKNVYVLSDLSVNNRLFVNGDASFNKNVAIAGNLALPSTGTHSISGNITITGNTSCGNSTVNGNETVTGTETVGNLVVSNSFTYTPSTISATGSITQPLSTIYFVNATASITITLPNPTINGQVVHFRRYTTNSTTFVITFATTTANFVIPITSATTGGTATISGTQTSTKFISYGSYWYQVYLQ